MERGTTKHGPAHDQEMAHETQQMIRGVPKPAHAEDWREPEPVEGSLPPIRRGEDADTRDIELRSELARILTRDLFPASRGALLARLEDSDAPPDLTERVTALPKNRHRFASGHDVLAALGLTSPETR